LHAFDRFPEEGRLVGRLLTAYADLEVALLQCVHAAVGNFDLVLKAMYRIRGETARLRIADGLGYAGFAGHNLDAHFSSAIDDMGYCRELRNSYAHSNWFVNHEGKLAFTALEKLAETNNFSESLEKLPTRYINAELLERQFDYFNHTGDRFGWLQHEVIGKPFGRRNPLGAWPAEMERPPRSL